VKMELRWTLQQTLHTPCHHAYQFYRHTKVDHCYLIFFVTISVPAKRNWCEWIVEQPASLLICPEKFFFLLISVLIVGVYEDNHQ